LTDEAFSDSQMKSPPPQRLHAEVLSDAWHFAALKEAWEDLYHNSPLATPFQSWAWLYSWWEYYGENYELRLITLQDRGLLVGLLPLMLEHRGGFFGRLLFIGTGITDYLDVLVREGWEQEVLDAGRRSLWQMGSWQVADLQELRPEAAAWGIFEEWPGPRVRIRQSGCPVLAVKSWEELLKSLSRNLRSTVRRALRRAEEDGITYELASVDDVEQAAHRFVALHRQMWQGRDIMPEHLTERFRSYMVAAVSRMTACGLGGISELWRDGEVLGSHLLVFGRDFVGEHLPGAKQEALHRYQLSSLYIWDAVSVANTRGNARVSLLRGEEPYKLRWTSEIVPNYRVILSRNPMFRGFYVGCLSLRFATRRYLSSDSTPQWVKDTLDWLRGR
jgi:CelD/BcsL family acetyltransferase involved in cellulose biosynthesis